MKSTHDFTEKQAYEEAVNDHVLVGKALSQEVYLPDRAKGRS